MGTISVSGVRYYGMRHYAPEMGRWLSRDPIGECGGFNLYPLVRNEPTDLRDALGEFAGRVEPIPERPGYYRLVPAVDEYRISRCKIVILAGHTTLMPGKLSVAKKDKGCAYGEIYGCFTGGGEAHLDDGRIVIVPPFETPGISGAPGKPRDFVDDDEIRALADEAFEAAKTAAKTMCGEPCCCAYVFISTEAVMSDGEYERWRDYDRELYEHLTGNTAIVKCGK